MNLKESARKLPFLPGLSFEDHSLTEKHHKKHVFDYKNGIPLVSDFVPGQTQALQKELNEIEQKIANLQKEKEESLQKTTDKSNLSLTLDRKVLRFYGFFKEGVHESKIEKFRIRKVTIYYHLEDDTIHVSESRQDNSGIDQGTLIKRHKIPNEDTQQYFSISDFNIGVIVTLYGKTIKIIDCDLFTKNFLENLGINIPPSISIPEDSFSQTRKKMQDTMKPNMNLSGEDREFKRYLEYSHKGRHTNPSFEEKTMVQNYLKKDRQVLRFYCIWDDTKNLHGDVRRFVLEYYLANGKIKISEKYDPNSGREPFPVFNKKSLIPKPKTYPVKYFTDKDLRIGVTIPAYSRKFFLYDCDDFTKQYYKEEYDYQEKDFIPIEVKTKKDKVKKVKIEPPPYNGFGSEEDSLGSWKYLVLKNPLKDIKKMIKLDKVILRFQAKLITNKHEDKDRRFVISYFLSDDTISIFEPPIRNSGIIGGKFLQRGKVKKPDGKYYTEKDLFLGAKVTIYNHSFEIINLDEFSKKYLKNKPKEFTIEDINALINKIRNLVMSRHGRTRDAFREIDHDHSGSITIQEIEELLKKLNLVVSKEELMTIMRYFDKDGDGEISFNEFKKTFFPINYTGISELPQVKSESDITGDKDLILLKQQNRNNLLLQKKIFKKFKHKMEMKTLLFQTVFRNISERSSDAKMGSEDFKEAIRKMQLHFTEKEIDALTKKLFGDKKRISLKTFVRIMEKNDEF